MFLADFRTGLAMVAIKVESLERKRFLPDDFRECSVCAWPVRELIRARPGRVLLAGVAKPGQRRRAQDPVPQGFVGSNPTPRTRNVTPSVGARTNSFSACAEGAGKDSASGTTKNT